MIQKSGPAPISMDFRGAMGKILSLMVEKYISATNRSDTKRVTLCINVVDVNSIYNGTYLIILASRWSIVAC